MTKKKIAYFISSAAFLGSATLFPVSADTVTVSGNGAFSDNNVHVSELHETDVRQENNTSISNNVSSRSNTGNNSANFNTGGDVSIHTGDARSNVSIDNKAGFNFANVGGDKDNDVWKIKVSDNGAFSDNNVHFSDNDKKYVRQENNTNIDNNVDVKSNTGYNHADGNTSYKNDDNNWEKKDWNNDSYKKSYEHKDFSENHNYVDSKKDYDQKDYKDHDYDKKDEYKSDNKDYDHKNFYTKNEWNDDYKDHDSYKKDDHDNKYWFDKKDNHDNWSKDDHNYSYKNDGWDKKDYDHKYVYVNYHSDKYAYLQNCHYYLTFLFKHKGYEGDYDCWDAYQYYLNHKNDYVKVTYYDHDDNKYDKNKHFSYKNSYDNEKYFKYSYAKKDHDNYDHKNWYGQDWKKYQKVDYKKDYGKKDDCKYFTQKYNNYYQPKNHKGNVSIHTGNAYSTVRIANTAGFNYASY